MATSTKTKGIPKKAAKKSSVSPEMAKAAKAASVVRPRDSKGRFLPELEVQCTVYKRWFPCKRTSDDDGRPICPACGKRHPASKYRRLNG